jgi:hypothetical protein
MLDNKADTAAWPQVNNKKYPREQEGFARALGVGEKMVARCSSIQFSHNVSLADFRGALPGRTGPQAMRNDVEWETSPAEAQETTVFTWIAGSQVRPVRPIFPYVTATLYVDGEAALKFPLGYAQSYEIREQDYVLRFEPRRFASTTEDFHRAFFPQGVSGFYRLEVPENKLTAGRPLTLRVELDPLHGNYNVVYYVSPRNDALHVDVATLRDEVAQLQADLVQLTKSHEMLYAQMYPELFPDRLQGKRSIIHQDETRHYHPATVTVMSDGEIVMSMREATDHLYPDGRLVLFRSRDNGETWSEKQVAYDLGRSDHRAGPIFELPNGEWLTTDYRYGAGYNSEGTMGYNGEPTLWSAWSQDKGKTWTFSDKPLTVPGAPSQYSEVERHMIQLPSGRLLVAANYHNRAREDGRPDSSKGYGLVVYRSDDLGRSWEVHGRLQHSHLDGEPTLLRTRSGKILLLARTARQGYEWIRKGSLLQSESHDDGETWSELQPTAMSSVSCPAHLLQLQDGRILCSHGARIYPGSIYVTVSRDEGETWDTERTRIVANDLPNWDSCYPTSGQMADGTIITVWYGNLFGKFFAAAMRYRPEDL